MFIVSFFYFSGLISFIILNFILFSNPISEQDTFLTSYLFPRSSFLIF